MMYIEVGLSTSNEGSKGETLKHMTWAKAHLMVIGGLILGKGPPNGMLVGCLYGPLQNSESYTAAALWFLNPDLTESEWPANWAPT
jgi:hypothetical protein